MPFAVVLPKVGMTMVEGTITEWFVQDGDDVTPGDRLFAFETEKVDYEVEAEAAGVIQITQPLDAIVEAGGTCAYILAEGEAPQDIAPAAAPPQAAPAAPAAAQPSARSPRAGGPVKASPVAKRLAAERGIDLTTVSGSGPGGRIVKEDIEAALAAGPAKAAPAAGPVKASPAAKRLATERGVDLATIRGSGPSGRIIVDDVESAGPPAAAAATTAALPPLSGGLPYRSMRRTVGQRMWESLQGMAQLTMAMEVDMTDAVKLRRDLIEAWEQEGPRVSYTDMVIKAAALALRDHPRLNATLQDETVSVQAHVHVGFAVALDEGLIVPVLRDTDAMPLRAIAAKSAQLAAKARDGALSPDDLTGGSFTVTSLGMYGIDVFTPIINPPQAAILGVGRIAERPAFVGDTGTQVERRAYLTLSLTIDHRLLDGAPGAQYLQSVRRYLEHPYLLLTNV